MTVLESFPPIVSPQARALILGSMPGEASLRAGQYYAHPQNHFWRIMGQVTGAGLERPYEERIAALHNANIALWDVLKHCTRQGSLDSAIRDEVPNDFARFLEQHGDITHIYFNGGKAQQSFRRMALRHLQDSQIQFSLLPSTSPAHARMTFVEKVLIWRKALKTSGVTLI